MNAAIAIVGMACCYPDAKNPRELWENVLSQRRAFRRLPAERVRLEDYFAGDSSAPDAIYATEAAFIEGYEFDRVRFRVAGSTYRSADMAHWLALDVADQALADAGFPDGNGLALETTGVLVGNTLTGEFSRAGALRLRWPYVRRTVEARLGAEGWESARRAEFLDQLEEDYKSPFPAVGEETLAGALSNTISGRICNHFHFGGGGYTVDGACSSSLLGVAHACSALESGELGAALAGGVDLSIDPFELVGFAKAGALAHGEMRIYDKESSGFLPGEGCGFVVLMRQGDAVAQGLRIYAVIRGWGISSDGGGGITRPEVRGQTLALERAYRRAGYGLESAALIEGHGTGTPIGDEVELQALSLMRNAAHGKTPPAAIGSIKANIGHTKAAAGIAGLIKATLAVHHQLLPPTTGVREPRPEVQGEDAGLRVLAEAEPWPNVMPVRAGVNSFGFGGINVHVTVEGEATRTAGISATEKFLSASAQDAELFVLDAESRAELIAKVEKLHDTASKLSYSELADVSAVLAEQAGFGSVRCSLVAATPAELAQRLGRLGELLRAGEVRRLDISEGLFLGVDCREPRIGLLFPGQASPARVSPGIQGRRFEDIATIYRQESLPDGLDGDAGVIAQLAIITAEVGGLRLLKKFGIEGRVAVGHSLGELAAYCWAGAIDEGSLLRLVRLRAEVMSQVPTHGSMAGIGAPAAEVASLIEDESKVVIACLNGPQQTVVSGESETVAALVSLAQGRGWTATILPTADAFHSPLIAPAAKSFRRGLANFDLQSLRKPVISTITGGELGHTADCRELLVKQLTTPVQFVQAMGQAESLTDLFIEVGPGNILANLSKPLTDVPAISIDIAGPSLASLFKAVGAAYALGASVRLSSLLNRFVRPIDLRCSQTFFANPCELAPIPVELEEIPKGMFSARAEKAAKSLVVQEIPSVTGDSAGSVVEVLRTLVAQRTELPSASVSETAQLLRDLHLNSIVVGEIIASAARQLGVVPPANLLSFSDASIGQLAVVLEEIRDSGGTAPAAQSVPAGVDDWCRTFFVDWLPRPIPASPETKAADGKWRIFGRPDHPFLQPLSNAALTGNGVVVCISDGPIDEHLEVLFAGARAAIDMPPDKYFVVLGPVKIVGSFARTINIEHPNILTRVIEAFPGSDVVGYVKAELSRPQTHIEARYDSEGARYEPCFKLLTPAPTGSIPIQHGEVVLVSGGAKGIAAECALALAKETGAKLVLLGRSGSDDPAVSAQLRTLEANGIVASYFPADVTDLEATRSAVGKAEQLHGPVVGIIHGAGHNQPMLAGDRDETKLWATFAVKVQGFRNLLRSANVDGLRLLVSFGSVIGRTGLRGQSDYALANAALSSLTEEFARAHPHCRCLAFESSAWSGIGMAERLGKIEALRHAGVTPIPAAEGISWFRKLIAQELPATSIVVTGRLGAECPIPITGPALPLLRFLERACVHYPGVELIVESDLTTISDPYVLDHVFRGQPLLPGVMGIEAMAQVARALHGGNEIPAVENLHFDHPIVVNPGDRVTLRIAALMRQCGKIDLSIRSSLTSFQSDHFRCSCVFEDEFLRLDHACAVPEPSCLAVDPERELYGSLLFQGPRFQRLSGYRRLGASLSWADIAPAAQAAWFNPYLPGTLVLGDAAIRDAALHSIQSCVPDSVLLPVGVDHISLSKLDSRNPVLAHATERWQDGDTYCYDLELLTPEGTVLEYWQGLRLRKIEDSKTQDWPDPLASALLEWQVRRAAPTARISAVFERERTKGEDRRRRSERSIQRAVDAPWPVRWTNNGKPEIDAPLDVSAAHSNGLTLAVASSQTVACDIEPICARAAEMWRDLLGSDRWLLARLIASQSDEDIHSAATRVWAAGETLAKADIPQSTPLGLLPPSVDKRGGISLTGSGATISTSVIRFRGDPTPFAVAVLVRSETCARTSIDTESALRRPTS